MKAVRNETFFIEGTRDEQYAWLNRELGLENLEVIPLESKVMQVSSFYGDDGNSEGFDGWQCIVLFFDNAMNPIMGTNITL